MRKVLAISGGVDSVCLLHVFRNDDGAIVAHFNHGTRPSADDDQKFVERLAKKYGKQFFTEKADLGENVSEEKARKVRYDFLKKVARENDAKIYTAHHLDDLVETIAINFSRGTSWRGLAPFGDTEITRPFLDLKYSKKDLLKYAAENELSFREDPTNHESNYLRNRFREELTFLDKKKKEQIYELFVKQKIIKSELYSEFELILPEDGVIKRSWFKELDKKTSIEFLRYSCEKHNINLTYPQLEKFLDAIQNYLPEKNFNLPNDKLVKIHKHYFKI